MRLTELYLVNKYYSTKSRYSWSRHEVNYYPNFDTKDFSDIDNFEKCLMITTAKDFNSISEEEYLKLKANK